MPNNSFPILLPSILSLLLLSFPHGHHRRLLAAADATFIQQTCKTTKHYDLCVSSLKSDPTSLQASDAKGLANIMIAIGVANSTATSAYISSQLPSTTTTTAAAAKKKAVFKECADKYGYAAEALQASAQDLAAESFDYTYMHVTAAADYPNSCHNAFRRYPGLPYPTELARREDGLKRICDVVLGIIDNLGW
ncbi:Pectinesterase inhibitor [Morus notabilis]|uniref:Pectinesterase inhibitor n=1 Tax=Morus notabilis TaxID=981085 RepID=W9SL32_9ROSA|nr:cell wall / vacuolar inhibitor of fructosidase 2 [Morus notabilis]EXC33634.1 Pectinesterase inhibitor [Morus notabilis]